MTIRWSARAGAALAITAASGGLWACGSNQSSSGGGGTGGAAVQVKPGDAAYAKYQGLSLDQKYHAPLPCTTSPTPEEEIAYTVPRAKKKYRVTLMEVTLAGYYYQGIAAGARKAAKEAGVDVQIVSAGQGYADAAAQIKQSDDVAQRGADALILAPADIQGAVPIVNHFTRDGKPVINVSTEVASPDAYMIMQDDYDMGRRSADQIAGLVGPKGGAGIVIAGPANATWSRKRAAGFADRVKERYPNIDIVASPTQNVDPALGLKSFENALQSNPNINWIYSDFDFLLQPKSLPDRYKDIAFVTNGYDNVSAPELESGRINSIIGLSPVAMGYRGVGTAVALLNGDKAPALQCVPMPVITKANMASPVAAAELIPVGFEK
jgi:ribose transport system substrate-binding protein